MKHFKKLLGCVVAFVMVFAICGSAFAAEQTDFSKIIHSGTSTNSYYTTQYVKQKDDNTLTNGVFSKNPPSATMRVYGAEKKSDGTYTRATSEYSFVEGCVIRIPDNSVVRHVHLRIYNYGNYVGTSVKTGGAWYLTA